MSYSSMVYRLGLAMLASLAVSCSDCNQPAPQPRPGTAYNGSAYWARDLAQPAISSFAADAELYSVMGMQVSLDGRLPANLGGWSIVAWSPSLRQQLQVNVRFDGSSTTSTSAQADPPGASRHAPPAGWVNSTTVLAATSGHRNASATLVTLAVFNLATYTQPIWGINFNVGDNQYVNWNGMYIGTSP